MLADRQNRELVLVEELVKKLLLFVILRSSHRMCSVKNAFLKVRKYHTNIPVLESVFNKVAGLRACNFITKKLQQRCFPVKFAKFVRTPFLTEHLRWLLLYHSKVHLYRLRISLTIQLNFALFLLAYIIL